ncbi:class I SAM-dependent methyltransferase [Thiobaca trueperi]|uniref:Methyltransferase family protein n=1 Tax=Thiobaca trueperi TaxID=127458 RepID=A0A4R3MR58_9GAMM|nr:class I SAM-dependent methyltransferase [Thiobaca trueperi]TCT18704.1 methyltransferase family protein [Thiobaca trueperi]
MQCPICGSHEKEVFAAKYVRAACCSNALCGHIWAVDALPDAGVQIKISPEQEENRYRARNKDLAQFLIKRRLLAPDYRLLDLGSGAGHILAALTEAVGSLQIVAVEPDPSGLARLRAQGFTAYSSLADVSDGDFNSVTMIEVIEHLSDPIDVLTQVRNRMADGGMIFFTTPVGETRYGGRGTNAYDTPEHVHFFTERSLALAFDKADFTQFRLETVNEMTGVLTAGAKGQLKNLLRPLRARVLGHRHLTGFAMKGQKLNRATAKPKP